MAVATPTLEIPKPYQDGLVKIGALKDQLIQELVQALPDVPVSVELDEIAEILNPQVKSISKQDLKEMMRTLIGLTHARQQLDVTPDDMVPLICNAMERSTNEDLKRTGEECENFSERLTRLLKVNSLELLAKAVGITTDHDCVFLGAHVLTDSRPIFGTDTESLPEAAAIIHTLSISYHKNGKRKGIYVAMSSKDVEALISTLKRAISKEKGLRKLLDAAKVPFLKTE